MTKPRCGQFVPSKLLLISIILLLCMLQDVDGQRVIASLGTKLKRLNSQRRNSRSLDGKHTIEGEGEKSSQHYLDYLYSFNQNNVEIVFAFVVVSITLIFFSYYKSKSSEKEDDIVVREDQVAPMGGLKTVDLGFSDLLMELQTKKKGESTNRLLLDGSVRGRAQPGRMLAIMGPSGAGKSSVLHALAGRVKESSKIHLEGMRYINGKPLTGDSMIPCAFVQQEVNFFPHMTVRETLNFRVELKLGSRIGKTARDELVNELIDELRLGKAADSIVGDAKVRGISGGERRRLSIACELISSPSIIFLDEPTSGLDSNAAASVVDRLRSLADKGKTIVAVIHQPSQQVFSSFDDLLLVSEGRQMYFGEVASVRQYMDTHVRKAPLEMGTAEHILDCISLAPMYGETSDDANKRIEKLGKIANSVEIKLGVEKGLVEYEKFAGQAVGGPKANLFTQMRLLLKRALRENFRSKVKMIVQTVQQVSLGVIYGGIYSIGLNQASIQDRFGLLSLIAIGAANMGIASTVRTFPKEKAIVSNEIASKMYGTLPYFFGKALSEFPQIAFFNSLFGVIVSTLTGLNKSVLKLRRFLGLNTLHALTSQAAGLLIGAIAPNSDTALAFFPAIMVLNIIFDGKNISEESTPRLLRWVPKVGLIRWGFEGLCLNEFEGLEFDTKGPRRGPVARNGDEALARFGLGTNSLAFVVRAQVLITSACWFLSYVGLTVTRQKFQVMEEPKKKKDEEVE